MFLGNTRCSAPAELKSSLRARFYKYCSPPGLKTNRSPYSQASRMEGFMFIDPASCFHAAAQRAKELRTDRLHRRREVPRVASPEAWEVAH